MNNLEPLSGLDNAPGLALAPNRILSGNEFLRGIAEQARRPISHRKKVCFRYTLTCP
jgi:hypothetical protein